MDTGEGTEWEVPKVSAASLQTSNESPSAYPLVQQIERPFLGDTLNFSIPLKSMGGLATFFHWLP